MSFGYGVSDFLKLCEVSWSIYKACRDAPTSFGQVAQEVLSLEAIMREVGDVLKGESLSPQQQASLQTLRTGCQSVLEELQGLVNKYHSLGTASKKAWDRLKWSSKSIGEIRTRLTSNTVLLTAYLRYVLRHDKYQSPLLSFQLFASCRERQTSKTCDRGARREAGGIGSGLSDSRVNLPG